MSKIALIFPHQLFEENPLTQKEYDIYLVEETLFFNQFAFHKQKLAFHRATMKFYEKHLNSKGFKVNYIEAHSSLSDVRKLIEHLAQKEPEEIHIIDPTDNWLQKRISKKAAELKLKLVIHDSPLFLTKKEDLQPFFRSDKKKFHQTSFYIEQRKHYKILLENEEKPKGGKWSFDDENRKKYPKQKTPPSVNYPKTEAVFEEAREYIQAHFSDNPGQLGESPLYPFNFSSAKKWLEEFLKNRFSDFGTYEDAIVKKESILHHSVLTPMLNVGLLTPDFVIDEALDYAKSSEIPINSLEGFIRQLIGWREFIRGIYEAKGNEQRTKNFWNFSRKIPKGFYTGSTGIPPIDHTIKKILHTGYCHHIERLMVLGNFMMLCEFDPDEVYRWFMELFIDAYDWVMVPNVYGMSQFADGGLMSTKPYISSSNYLMKMSDYEKGDWQETWDGLFWRFMHVHRDFFTQNPRLGMLVKTLDKMDDQKKKNHLKNAEEFLNHLAD
ncbi:cryptochrome/photolyase family protein [Flexithrix dorotheae]|uniref:cryptochrome/photolyase family protein n=1 Tax=Flexithrix dorotheae TaxID=70993 RepID=UPI0003809D1B|nr:cryptochrome/photolyase family protein [Flexithrix dorotheae]